ncbi:MAG: hypothetical protein ACKOX3_02685 [Bacteroidota bacterium]
MNIKEKSILLIIIYFPIAWLISIYTSLLIFYIENERLPIPSLDDPKNLKLSIFSTIVECGFFIAFLSVVMGAIYFSQNLKNEEFDKRKRIILITGILLFTIQWFIDPFNLIKWIGD